MSPMRGCWSCGSHGPCYGECECAKCVDPGDYEEWRNYNPEAYDAWLDRQELDGEECDCPGCVSP